MESMLLIAKETPRGCNPMGGERRCGIDRRVMAYDRHIPERRTGLDRRGAERYFFGTNQPEPARVEIVPAAG